jgi:hypothetical protein
MIKSYRFLLIFLAIFAPIYATCFIAGSAYNNYVYGKALDQFNQGKLQNKPDPNVLLFEEPCLSRSREFNIIYNEVNHLSDKNNILLIGSSSVVNGIVVHESTIPKNWDIHNVAISGGLSFTEMMLMINYLNTYANHKPDKSDVIVLHIFYSTFKEPPANERYVTQLIEAYSVYRVDDDQHVHGYMPGFYREWMSSKRTIIMALSSFTSINLFSPSASLLTKALEIINNISNLFSKPRVQTSDNPYYSSSTYHAPSQIAEYKDFWTRFTRGIKFPNSETEQFNSFLAKLHTQTNIVVVNMYLPSWQKEIAKQKGYEEWTQSDLIPFLQENKIAYVDLYNSFHDEEYADSGHLNWAGREHFTKLFDDSVKPVLSTISSLPLAP